MDGVGEIRMTEQPGHLNAPDLVEECAKALSDDGTSWLKGCWANGDHYMGWADVPDEIYVQSVLSVLRKRGLLTGQALELLADK